VLAVSLALTTAATALVSASTTARDEARFGNAVQSASDRVAMRLDIYIAVLRGTAALFSAESEVDAEEFRRYVQRMEVQRWYPGIQGIGWSERLETSLPGEVDERYAIRYLEPLDVRNQAAVGFDMYSDSTRREAKRQARDHGEPALSGRVVLRQEILGPRQFGFLLYLPVYREGGIPASVPQRRESLLGFVYAPFRAQDLLVGIFGSEAQPRVSLSVYDGPLADTSTMLAEFGREAGHASRYRATQRILVAGREWTLVFASSRRFEAGSTRAFVTVVLLIGIAASAGMFVLALGLSRARVAAEHANRAKSKFLATMSHELRTPLNAIGGYVDLMQMGLGGPLSATHSSYLGRMQRAQRHLLALINDVLNVAQLDAGRVQYRITPVAVPAIVTDVVSMVALQAARKSVELVVEGGVDDTCVSADEEKLRQILLNLCSNAVKFTESGGRVVIRWRTVEHHAEIEVADTGIGIPPDRLEAICEPFVQIDTNPGLAQQGTGLGLAIARELARAMDGEIHVTSSPRGSTFTLSLPVAEPPSV
jgi:signal transduction histidine kinase